MNPLPQPVQAIVRQAEATTAMTETMVEGLLQAAFGPGVARTPRSVEYLEGVRAALLFRALHRRITCAYKVGTAQADAYYAGIDEGHSLWRRQEARQRARQAGDR